MSSVFGSDVLTVPHVLIPILIFFARIVDVSFGTLRILLVGKGMRVYASVLGFFEVFIWLLAISQVLQNMNGLYSYIMYSAGFAVGTFVGMTIERRFILGTSIIRIIVPQEDAGLAQMLKDHGHRITHLDARGHKGPVEVIFSVVKRDKLRDILRVIRRDRPNAFYSIEDVRTAAADRDGANGWIENRQLLNPFFWFRKSK
jgi:uncharacterized protein YebE (UPF0316 family)